MKKLLTLVLVLFAMSEMMSATSATNYLLDSIVRVDESTGFVDSKKLYEYHENGTMQMSINLRATWSSWKVGVPKILNSKTTLVYDEEGHELDYFSSVLDTATGIWKDTHHYLYDERHNRICGVRKWNSDSTVVLQGSHYYYDEDNFQIGSDQFDTWNGVQVLDYKCENIKDEHGNKIIMVEYSKPENAWEGDYMSDPNAFNETGWVRIDSVFYTYNEKQEKTRETIYRWNNDTQEWTMDGYQIFEYDEEGHCIADTVFARDFETNVITYNNMTANTYDSHGKLSRIQMYMPNFTGNGVEWIENGKYAYDYTYDENGEILQLRDYIDWQSGSSSTTYYTSTYFYSEHPAQDEPETCIFASGICGGDLTWELTCDSVLTIKGTGMMYEYSDWNSPWRPYKDSIKSVIIEEGVTTISTAAFRDHGHLQSCILPSTIESIGNEAFCFCFQLMYIEIPPSCTAFGDGSFNLVPNVIIQDESILPYSGSARSLNGYVDGLFVYDNSEKRSLRACSSAAKGEITLDDAIERIEYMAFAQCEDITHINFGSNLKYIGEWSLDGCRGLDGLQFQEGLTEIATHGFGNCFGLRYVSLPNSLTTLGDFAIGNCPDLRVIRLGDSLKYVGYQIFDYCQSIDTIYASMPTPPVLDETAFASTDLSKVICLVPDQSVSLYKEALVWKQMNVKSIDVPEPIIIASGTCGDNLLWKLTSDSTLTISGTGAMTLNGSYGGAPWHTFVSFIKIVNLPDGLTSIGKCAFANCSKLTSINIPTSVSSIGAGAFIDCSTLQSLVIPDGITRIERELCANCSNLLHVNIPNTVESIGQQAFEKCMSLNKIVIPSSVTSIERRAFHWCSNLKGVYISDIAAWCAISIEDEYGNPLYWAAHMYMNDEEITELVIPEGVISIGNYAFDCAFGLKSVTIPNTVTSIGIDAFRGSHIENVTWGNNIATIGDRAFYLCSNMTNIDLPASLTYLGKEVFYGCGSVKFITCTAVAPPSCGVNPFIDMHKSLPLYVPLESVEAYKVADQWKDFTNIQPIKCIIASGFCGADLTWELSCDGVLTISGTGAMSEYETYPHHGPWYSQRDKITSLVINEGVTSVGYYAFSGCSSLTSVTIGNSVTKIGKDAFYKCSALTTIIGPAGILETEEGYWNLCTRSLKSVTFTNGELTDNVKGVLARSKKTLTILDISRISNTELNDEAINGFYNLQSLALPANLETIGYMSVADCKSLQRITIPASVIEIGPSAFEDCRSLNDLTFAEGSILETIGAWAFYNCHNLPKIEIPDGVTEIGDAAFYGCVYAESLKLPASVQSIGDNAFALCSKLNRMDVEAVEPPAIVAKTFYEVSRKAPVYVPDASVSQYKADPLWGELNIVGQHGAPTAVDNTAIHEEATKILRDGQILILRGDKTYTITGQKLR